MRIQRTSQIITAGIMVLSLLAIVCAVVSRNFRIVEERAYETRRKMKFASGCDRCRRRRKCPSCAATPERLVVFLGDVSGKGIPASMFMVRAISLARLLARDIAEPERILARLNDELAVDNPSGMFVTFLCAVFDPRSGRLVIANAGHCRPVLLRAGVTPVWAVKNLGTALGFEPGLEFERTELTLPQGDSLIFYTDGVSEAFDERK